MECLAEPNEQSSMCVTTTDSSVLHNWHATKATVKLKLAYMFNNEVMSDASLHVGMPPNKQQLSVHKFVLPIGSAVLNAMLNG